MSGNILITGGSKRFGRALAISLQARGYDVIITYRNKDGDLSKLSDLGIVCLKADFSNTKSINNFIDKILKNFSSLRALIHNASDWIPESPDLSLEEVFKKNISVHVEAPYLMNINFKDLLVNYANENDMADIIHLTDFVAEKGSSKHIAYAASKAALSNLTLSFASKFSPKIKVNNIAPALLMYRDSDDETYKKKVDKKSLLPPGPGPDEGIDLVLMLLKSKYITGRTMALDGGRHLKTC